MNDTIVTTLIQEIGPILISAIAAWLAWLLRKYVNSVSDEKKLAAIVRVANAAIDYAEDLDKRGDLEKMLARLDLPNEAIHHTSKGIQKLHVASKWVEDELKRMGINMTDEEARKWIAAEFQKRVSGFGLTPEQLIQLRDILTVLSKLDQDKLRILLMGNGQLTPQHSEPLPQSDLTPAESKPAPKLTTVEVEPAPAVAEPEPEPSPESDLAEIARQAFEYVETLKIGRQLTVPELDIATAWMLTEVTKRDLNVTPEQIAREIHLAFGN